jgi:rhodanese-related sulfurtransferase
VLYFGVPGVGGTYLGAALSAFVSGAFQLTLFALVMLLAAVLMFRASPIAEANARRQAAWKIGIEGLLVGILTGLVGVGGGFLIVPALVLLGGLPMRLAVGTSLLIIAAKSLAGFVKYVDVLAGEGIGIDWGIIGIFSVIGIAGSFLGNRIGTHIPQRALKRGFAVFLLLMGAFILAKEGPSLFSSDPAAPLVVSDHSRVTIAPAKLTEPMSFISRLMGRTPSNDIDIPEQEYVSRHGPEDVVIDVRTPGEYADGHLAGAPNVDMMSPDFAERFDQLGLDTESPIYLYCRSGNRSNRAAKILRDRGFEKAYNIGGYEALVKAGAQSEQD